LKGLGEYRPFEDDLAMTKKRSLRKLNRRAALMGMGHAAAGANLSLVVGSCQRQAAPAATLSADAPPAAQTGLLNALLIVWTRIFVPPEPVGA
jgi:hypothetical protein